MIEVFALASSAFTHGGSIPEIYTGDGADISPPLEWTAPPAGTASLVLICEDPDAPVGNWIHWVVFDIPPDSTGLPEGVPPGTRYGASALQGLNSWGSCGYGGPAPPSGTHRYFFRLYALDCMLRIGARSTAEMVRRAMEGHVLASAELMGTYTRNR
ncbi:YbhB/YbcL family Raf kinase inhibitor-like protein [Candidatus Fermentibacteria bacterium]|nr:YbhB/YbcL family Raf kinase inhibitor-like protein [Candidatus Fermentibacteria bacterium]